MDAKLVLICQQLGSVALDADITNYSVYNITFVFGFTTNCRMIIATHKNRKKC